MLLALIPERLKAWWWGCEWTAKHHLPAVPELASGCLSWYRCRECGVLIPR